MDVIIISIKFLLNRLIENLRYIDFNSTLYYIVIPILCSFIIGGLIFIGIRSILKKHYKEQLKYDLMKYKPRLEFQAINEDVPCMVREVGLGTIYNGEEEGLKEFDKYQRSNNPKFRIIFKNKGRGETYNAILEDFKINSTNWKDNSLLYSNIAPKQYIGEVLNNEYLAIEINLSDFIFMPKDLELGVITTKIDITYSDIFNINKYKYSLYLTFRIEKEEMVNKPFDYKDYEFYKVKYYLDTVMPERLIYSKKNKKYVHEAEFMKENQ